MLRFKGRCSPAENGCHHASRSGGRVTSLRSGEVLHGATPELFRGVLDHAISILKDRPPERRLLFLKSWNEWAEGNHLEPDLKFGSSFLQVIGEAIGALSKGVPHPVFERARSV